MNAEVIIILVLAALGIGGALFAFFITPPEKRGTEKEKQKKSRSYISFFSVLGVYELFSWKIGTANDYALYFGVAFLIGALVIWVIVDDKKST